MAKLAVNGYKVPNGASGVAVRKACELITASPGISQKEVLEVAVRFSGLNFSTATWITSPSSKSPAGLLWDRRKEGTFKCYPNEFTSQVVGSVELLRDHLLKDVRKGWGDRLPQDGEVVRIAPGYQQPNERFGYLLGGTLTTYERREKFSLSMLADNQLFQDGSFGFHAEVITNGRTEICYWTEISPLS